MTMRNYLIKADNIHHTTEINLRRIDAEDASILESQLSVDHADSQGSRQCWCYGNGYDISGTEYNVPGRCLVKKICTTPTPRD